MSQALFPFPHSRPEDVSHSLLSLSAQISAGNQSNVGTRRYGNFGRCKLGYGNGPQASMPMLVCFIPAMLHPMPMLVCRHRDFMNQADVLGLA
eukprot:181646-Pelagomonas_calceolata.AAC.2